MAKTTRESDTGAERQTGQDATLKVKSGGTYYKIPVTNVSWSRDIETTEIQHNDDLTPVIATTGIRFSGSFEWSGNNWDAMQKFFASGEGDLERNAPNVVTLTVKETYETETESGSATTTYTYTFRKVKATSHSRDLPSDGATTSSIDWSAEGAKFSS